MTRPLAILELIGAGGVGDRAGGRALSTMALSLPRLGKIVVMKADTPRRAGDATRWARYLCLDARHLLVAGVVAARQLRTGMVPRGSTWRKGFGDIPVIDQVAWHALARQGARRSRASTGTRSAITLLPSYFVFGALYRAARDRRLGRSSSRPSPSVSSILALPPMLVDARRVEGRAEDRVPDRVRR